MLQSIHARWRHDNYWLLLNSRPIRSFLEEDTVAVANGGRGRFISTNEDGSITVENGRLSYTYYMDVCGISTPAA
jgi:hypothetical protein